MIATLIYLAVQLGQTKEMMRMESARSTTKDFSAFMYELTEPSRMELFRRGIDGFESMEPNDQARLHAYLTAIFLAAQSTFMQSGRGPAEKSMADAFDVFNAAMIRSTGFAAWWKKAKKFFSPDFAHHLDALAAAQQGAPLITELLPWYRWPDVDPAPFQQ